MQPFELTSFLQKFAAGINTEAEHQQFTEWLKTAPIAAVENAMELYLALSTRQAQAETDSLLISHIEASLDQYQLASHDNYRMVPIRSWKKFTRMAAAIFILLLAGSIAWLIFKNNARNMVPVVAKKQTPAAHELTPGGNKALLTLSDGSIISLDDIKNGKIAQQGNTLVDKSANGQLEYKPLKEKATEIVYNTLTTPRGGQFKLNLPDGSKVWLNAASSIKYPTAFSGMERKVEISGEAYFEIAHNAAQPFIVAVNGMEVKVLGTHFNINAYNDESSIKTSLLEGSIRLTKAASAVTLTPGQQAQLAFTGNIKVLDDVDMEEVVAWKNGYFSFNRADLQTVMRQIARWYDVDIRYEGNIPERSFGGKIDRSSNASEVLKVLAESNVHFIIEDKKIIVKP